MKRTGLILAVSVILVSNGIALIGVANNRTGGPFETIELTERELSLPGGDQDNSGIDLRLNWSPPSLQRTFGPFDRAKLEQIGFKLRIPEGTPQNEIALLPREAYVAFEYEGEAWKQEQQRAAEEKQRSQTPPPGPAGSLPVPRDAALDSHLFAVDASRSASELRSRYPDQSKILILRAVVRVRCEGVKDPGTGAVKSSLCTGHVAQVLPFFVHVPLPYARLLSPLKPRGPGQGPRYSVTLHYGRNLEPWVGSIRSH